MVTKTQLEDFWSDAKTLAIPTLCAGTTRDWCESEILGPCRVRHDPALPARTDLLTTVIWHKTMPQVRFLYPHARSHV